MQILGPSTPEIFKVSEVAEQPALKTTHTGSGREVRVQLGEIVQRADDRALSTPWERGARNAGGPGPSADRGSQGPGGCVFTSPQVMPRTHTLRTQLSWKENGLGGGAASWALVCPDAKPILRSPPSRKAISKQGIQWLLGEQQEQ